MRYSRETIEKVKEEICEVAAGLRRKNEIAPVSGRRMTISMPDRLVWYFIRQRRKMLR